MGGKGGGANANDAVYVVLERGVAMDLFNALYIALGIVPGNGKSGGVKDGKEMGVKTGGGKPGGGKGGGKPGGGGSKSGAERPGGSGKVK